MSEGFSEEILKETPPVCQAGAEENEWLMLDDSLAMTPWERILANDDMVNFGDSLHAAMEEEMQNLAKLTRRLMEARVEFVLVGGFAAVSHGALRSTRDADLVTVKELKEIKKRRQ